MAKFFQSDVVAAGLLTDAVATGGSLDATKLILVRAYTGGPNPSGDMTQFSECDFTGYAPVAALVWGTPFKDIADGLWKVAAPSHNFVGGTPTPPATFVSNVVIGEVYTDAAKTEYRGFKLYANPISITAPGQGFIAEPEMPILAQQGLAAD